MKLKDLQLKTDSVYLNIYYGTIVKTDTLSATEAVEQYGELEVIQYIPSDGDSEEQSPMSMDIIILKSDEEYLDHSTGDKIEPTDDGLKL